MSLHYYASHAGLSYKISLLYEAKEYMMDGCPNFWRVTLHPAVENNPEIVSGGLRP